MYFTNVKNKKVASNKALKNNLMLIAFRYSWFSPLWIRFQGENLFADKD